MSSVNSRLIIESYTSGGYGIFIEYEDYMGLNKKEVKTMIKDWLNNEEKYKKVIENESRNKEQNRT